MSVNHHSLSDFRVEQVGFLDRLLTHSVAVLMSQGLVTLQRVAQDGMRVRASAGAASFRRKPKLRQCLKAAREQIDRLRQELEEDPEATNRRQVAARWRAAEERHRRVTEALERLRRRSRPDKVTGAAIQPAYLPPSPSALHLHSPRRAGCPPSPGLARPAKHSAARCLRRFYPPNPAPTGDLFTDSEASRGAGRGNEDFRPTRDRGAPEGARRHAAGAREMAELARVASA